MKKLKKLLCVTTRAELRRVRICAFKTFGYAIFFAPWEFTWHKDIVPTDKHVIQCIGTQAMEARMQTQSLANLAIPAMSGTLAQRDVARIEHYARHFRAELTYRGWQNCWETIACLCEQMNRQ